MSNLFNFELDAVMSLDPPKPSPPDQNQPLKLKPGYWDIASAVVWLQTMQIEAHELGYNLALAGGVLNNGFSENDLDVIAVPRCHGTPVDYNGLLDLFGVAGINRTGFLIGPPTRRVVVCTPVEGKPHVDLIVFLEQ